nr:hypothetical protein [Pandoravirus belohorizontensis]
MALDLNRNRTDGSDDGARLEETRRRPAAIQRPVHAVFFSLIRRRHNGREKKKDNTIHRRRFFVGSFFLSCCGRSPFVVEREGAGAAAPVVLGQTHGQKETLARLLPGRAARATFFFVVGPPREKAQPLGRHQSAPPRTPTHGWPPSTPPLTP